MQTVLDTDSVRLAERFGWWREVVCRSFVHLDVEPLERGSPFRARISTTRIGEEAVVPSGGRTTSGPAIVQASRVEASAQRVARSEARLMEDSGEYTIAMLQRAGRALVVQDGTAIAMRPGSIAALDSGRPYRIDFDGPFEQIVVKVPTRVLAERLDGRPPRLARPPDTQSLLAARLLQPAVDALFEPWPASQGGRLARLILDALAIALAPAEPDTPRSVARRSATARVDRAREHVLARLRGPGLDIRGVAAAQGVTPRMLQRLFAERGLTLSRFILEARLDACCAALQDPAQRAASILDIALAHGFSDPSHFARAFKRRFGMAPSKVRP